MVEAPRTILEQFADSLNRQDWAALEQICHPDFVDEWPQTGEVVRGVANLKQVIANFPNSEKLVGGIRQTHIVGVEDRWFMTPTFSVIRVEGTADVYTSVSRIRYPDDSIWYAVALVQLRDGKLWRMTTYFAPQLPAPDWRAKWVERTERGTA